MIVTPVGKEKLSLQVVKSLQVFGNISLFVFFAFGYSIWIYPKSVYKGYKKGLKNIGIIDLKVSKDVFF